MTLHRYPRSNASVRSGDFCFVMRADGRVALFIYLYPQGTSRSYFFGTLAAETLPAPSMELIPPHVGLTEQALLHIKCFRDNDTPVAGNILDRMDATLMRAMRAEAHSHAVGSIQRVWGHATILTRANAIAD